MSKYSKKTPKPSPSMGSIRIISGLWRGRKLPVRDADGLRPTTDRIKETLFNWIAPTLPNARCLDLFAGSGSLGFEAASRQASHVTMIELDKGNCQQLSKNCEVLKDHPIELHNKNALQFLEDVSESENGYDIVFIDPPFRQDLLNQSIQLLELKNWLNDEAYIYIEMEKELQGLEIPTNWKLHREKVAGQVACRLYIKDAT